MHADRHLISFAVLFVGYALSAGATAPLVVAVDTSRSLTPSQVTAIRTAVEQTTEALQPPPAMGLLEFNDSPRWIVEPPATADAVVAALGDLRPAGRYTALNDALFLAARALPDGGVVLLVTDGRDENSATTVDDVARVCESNGVRIVAASQGTRIDERTLRRLALLTGGRYTGPLRQTAPGDLANVLRSVRTSVLDARPIAVTPPPVATPVPPPGPVVRTTAERSATGLAALPWWALPSAVLALAIIAFAVWRATRRPEQPQRVCATCGAELEDWETACSVCEAAEESADMDEPEPPADDAVQLVTDAYRTQSVAETAVPDASLLDPEVFNKAPVPDGLEQTLVIDEQPVLISHEPEGSPRSFQLPRNKIFAVGRAPKVNTLQIDEPTVSAQHFRIVPKDGDFFVVDLETTNGTVVNGKRVTVRRLESGDTIHAGTREFEFRMVLRRLA